ncbi:hypothetical protein KUTeg_004441 [Tegillarca granosa]|uniref:Uncharacterized protein n=1 Tax=Tegillarca granosa TaxID=220873 RepID=A0ABQ9FUG4_TEGGR|nr:hypothetical protein KUTeg_004441 [Tegillarca granosa]
MHCGPKLMAITSLFLGAIAVGVLSLSIATDAWVYQTEPVTYSDNNDTHIIVPTHSRSGLWRVCTITEIDLCHVMIPFRKIVNDSRFKNNEAKVGYKASLFV